MGCLSLYHENVLEVLEGAVDWSIILQAMPWLLKFLLGT